MSPCSKNTRLALLLASRGWVSCWLFAMPRRVAALGAEVPRCCGPLALLQPELLACWDGETCAISPQHSRPKKIWSFLLQDQISTQVLEEAGPVAAPCQGDASLCRLAPAGRSPLSCRSLLLLLGACSLAALLHRPFCALLPQEAIAVPGSGFEVCFQLLGALSVGLSHL